MKVLIEIDDKDYADIMSDSERNLNHYERLIKKGVPLPKGHGDLKDTEKLKNAFVAWSMAVQGNFTDADIANIVCNSPTIIEADKGESGDKE